VLRDSRRLPIYRFWTRDEAYELDGGLIRPRRKAPFVEIDLPADLWTQVLQINVFDEKQILGFSQKWGVLGYDGHFLRFSQSPILAPVLDEMIATLLLYPRTVEAPIEWPPAETVSNFALGASWIQLFAACLFALTHETDPPTRWPARILSGMGEGEIRGVLFEGINEGLKSLSVVLADPDTDGASGFFVDSPQSLFSHCCLEIANHIASGQQLKTCANETCGLPFTLHQGRSAHGSYRSDSKYCCKSCTNAQMQREHRRRKKEQNGPHN